MSEKFEAIGTSHSKKASTAASNVFVLFLLLPATIEASLSSPEVPAAVALPMSFS